jgi:hypothetical protein
MFSKKPTAAAPLAALCAAMALSMPSAGAAEQPGMVVARDPQTGELRTPTPAELKALRQQGGEASMMGRAAAEAPAATAPAAVARTDGVRQFRLGERAMVYSVVTRDADGKLVQQCVEGEHAADKAVKSGAPAARQNGGHSHE